MVLAVLGSACGGGSSSPAGNSPPVSPPPVASGPGGLWFGTLTFDEGGFVEEMIGLSANDGRFRFLSVDSETQFSGAILLSGNSFDGDARAFADPNTQWLDGSAVVDATVTGIIEQRDSWSGSWSSASGESGTFDLLYDALAGKAANLSLFEGVWSVYDEFENPTATFTMSADGGFTGQNAEGCTSAGQLTVITANLNVYDVESQISGCPIAGTYTGMAFIADLFTDNDVAVLALDDDQLAFVVPLQR
jgi:hypothetical protein